jgi:DNA-binding response OmpR family regulator
MAQRGSLGANPLSDRAGRVADPVRIGVRANPRATPRPIPRTNPRPIPRPIPRLLLVEDDAPTATDLVRGLKVGGFDVELATSSRDAARSIGRSAYDAIVLDLMLATDDGFSLLTRARSRGHTQVFVLSARGELRERLRAFELGAADFVSKPFWIEELVARLRSRLNLPVNSESKRLVRWSSCELDLDARTLERDGRPIALTPTEFAVLAYLVERPRRSVSRGILASQALASIDRPDARTVDSHVAHVRRKLGPAAHAIATAWGIGYRFEPPAGEAESDP